MSKLLNLEQNLIPIKKLAKVFEKVDELFAPLISQAGDPAVERKLQTTKKEIFDAFIVNTNWDDAVNKSVERVQENLKDDRNILQKVRDGFKRAMEMISNWWNKIEEPKKPEPIEAKQTSLRFKAEMGKLKEDDLPVNSNSPTIG
jgi:hypothetical protein